MTQPQYIIRDREAGNTIDSFMTSDEAKKDGTYVPNFYQIWDNIKHNEFN